MTTPVPIGKPRSIAVTFWCWVVAAVLTAVFGMLLASIENPLGVIRFAGLILVVVALAQGYLAGRANRGQQRFATAGVGLAMASVVFLAALLLFGASLLGILLVAVIMVLLVVGSVFSQRPASQQWFETQGAM